MASRYTTGSALAGAGMADEAMTKQREQEIKYSQLRSQNKLNESMARLNEATVPFRFAGSRMSAEQANAFAGQEQRQQEKFTDIDMPLDLMRKTQVQRNMQREEEAYQALAAIGRRHGYQSPEYLMATQTFNSTISTIQSSIATGLEQANNAEQLRYAQEKDLGKVKVDAELAEKRLAARTAWSKLQDINFLDKEIKSVDGDGNVTMLESPRDAKHRLAVEMATWSIKEIEARVEMVSRQSKFIDSQSASILSKTLREEDFQTVRKMGLKLQNRAQRSAIGLTDQQGNLLQQQLDTTNGIISQIRVLDDAYSQRIDANGELSEEDFESYIAKHTILSKEFRGQPWGMGEMTARLASFAGLKDGTARSGALRQVVAMNTAMNIEYAGKVGMMDLFTERFGSESGKMLSQFNLNTKDGMGMALAMMGFPNAAEIWQQNMIHQSSLESKGAGHLLQVPGGRIAHQQMSSGSWTKALETYGEWNQQMISLYQGAALAPILDRHEVNSTFIGERGDGNKSEGTADKRLARLQKLTSRDGVFPDENGGMRKLTEEEIGALQGQLDSDVIGKKIKLASRVTGAMHKFYNGHYNKGMWGSPEGKNFALDSEYFILSQINVTLPEDQRLEPEQIEEMVKEGYHLYRSVATDSNSTVDKTRVHTSTGDWEPDARVRNSQLQLSNPMAIRRALHSIIGKGKSTPSNLDGKFKKNQSLQVGLAAAKDTISQYTEESNKAAIDKIKRELGLDPQVNIGEKDVLYDFLEALVEAAEYGGATKASNKKSKSTSTKTASGGFGSQTGRFPVAAGRDTLVRTE